MNNIALVNDEEDVIEDELLTVDELAMREGVEPKTIRRRLKEFKQPYVSKVQNSAVGQKAYLYSYYSWTTNVHNWNTSKVLEAADDTNKQTFMTGAIVQQCIKAVQYGSFDERKEAVALMNKVAPGFGTAYEDKVFEASHYILTNKNIRAERDLLISRYVK